MHCNKSYMNVAPLSLSLSRSVTVKISCHTVLTLLLCDDVR